jgi:cytochrome c1
VSTGKLFNSYNDELIANVNYQFQHEDEHNWWGELTLVEYKQIKDGSGYTIVLEDGRKCHCNLKKRVNRAVTSLPPRYVYHFSGNGQFTQ